MARLALWQDQRGEADFLVAAHVARPRTLARRTSTGPTPVLIARRVLCRDLQHGELLARPCLKRNVECKFCHHFLRRTKRCSSSRKCPARRARNGAIIGPIGLQRPRPAALSLSFPGPGTARHLADRNSFPPPNMHSGANWCGCAASSAELGRSRTALPSPAQSGFADNRRGF
jgi:hypothetical protein